MKVLVKRTSDYIAPPCAEAIAETFDRREERSCTEEIFNKKFSTFEGFWKDKGYGHTTCKDGRHIVRYHKNREAGFFIDINTLGELLAFCEKHGECVIQHFDSTKSAMHGASFCLEIYDDYRE